MARSSKGTLAVPGRQRCPVRRFLVGAQPTSVTDIAERRRRTIGGVSYPRHSAHRTQSETLCQYRTSRSASADSIAAYALSVPGIA
eukprot:2202497-Rhodomonas_salina.3